jgi:hypothetical protein
MERAKEPAGYGVVTYITERYSGTEYRGTCQFKEKSNMSREKSR